MARHIRKLPDGQKDHREEGGEGEDIAQGRCPGIQALVAAQLVFLLQPTFILYQGEADSPEPVGPVSEAAPRLSGRRPGSFAASRRMEIASLKLGGSVLAYWLIGVGPVHGPGS